MSSVALIAKAKQLLNKFHGDKESALDYVVKNRTCDEISEHDDEAIVLGWQQAFRSSQTSDRSFSPPGSNSEKFVSGRTNGSISRAPQRKLKPLSPRQARIVEAAHSAEYEFVVRYPMPFGTNVSLAKATSRDFDAAIKGHSALEAGNRNKRLFMTAVKALLPIGSLTATLRPDQYKTVYDLHREHFDHEAAA